MKSLRLRAFGKANLSLNITGKRDGLHMLDSVMTSVDVFDTVTVTERTDGKIAVRFLNAPVDEVKNTAYKAASAVMSAFDFGGVDVEIEKGIPIGAGLGGSSADGAAVLRALDIFYRLPERGIDMRALALSVGSDVPFMLTGGSARVTGVGEKLFFFENKLPLFAVGLMSETVSTAAAYAEFDEQYGTSYEPTDNKKLVELLMNGDASATALFDNALYGPAAKLAPSVADSVGVLGGCGAAAKLTGSGGMVLGWFTELDKFALCASALRDKVGFKALSTARTGILHEWISRE
ncbi:MAG: hypothetical protein J1G38_07635 [Clostridiales bacterium]|nr:hypothetical protein [Clostridiales bacterium]